MPPALAAASPGLPALTCSSTREPVDWFEWGKAAFAEARRRDVPSCCPWLRLVPLVPRHGRRILRRPGHADLMNRWFVNVKVDRRSGRRRRPLPGGGADPHGRVVGR